MEGFLQSAVISIFTHEDFFGFVVEDFNFFSLNLLFCSLMRNVRFTLDYRMGGGLDKGYHIKTVIFILIKVSFSTSCDKCLS